MPVGVAHREDPISEGIGTITDFLERGTADVGGPQGHCVEPAKRWCPAPRTRLRRRTTSGGPGAMTIDTNDVPPEATNDEGPEP